MTDSNTREDLFRRYLLGLLEADEQERLEGRLLFDEDDLEELQIAEDELIDQYICDSLSVPERERFERFFLATPERQRKIQFARALHKYVGREEAAPVALTTAEEPSSGFWERLFGRPARQPLFSPAIAVTLILVIGVASWLLVKNNSRPAVPALNEGRPAVVLLSPGGTRGTGSSTADNTVLITDTTSVIEAQLELRSDDYPSYEARLETLEGREVYKLSGLKSETTATKRLIICRLPVERLTSGDYRIVLRGIPPGGTGEDVERYSLRVKTSS